MRGARIIPVSVYNPGLEASAFVNPDGSRVTVVLNRSDNDMAFTLYDGRKAAGQVCPDILQQLLSAEENLLNRAAEDKQIRCRRL